jgi:signal transduction histidine kinase
VTHAGARRVTRAVLGANAVLFVGALWLTWLNRSKNTVGDVVTISVFILSLTAFSAIGAVMATRVRRNPVGWAFLLLPLGFLVSVNASEWARHTIEVAPGSLPFGTWAEWFSSWDFIPFIGLVPLVILLFPDGSPPSSRWRGVAWLILAGIVLGSVGSALRPGPIEVDPGFAIENPAAVGPLGVWKVVLTLAGIAVGGGAVLAIVSMAMRFRRSRGDERQQLRWFLFACVLTAIAFVATAVTTPPNGAATPLNDALFALFVLSLGIGIPAASAVAILRYHLYELDVVVKKTVLVATVGILLAALFLVVLVGAGAFLGQGDVPSVVAAGAIGLAFWPAIRLARRIADHAVYGRRATPYEVVTTFADRLSETYGAEDVLPRLARILSDGVGAERATVWLRIGRELRPVAVAPADAERGVPLEATGDELPSIPGADVAAEVRDGGELLGALAVAMPANDPIDPTRERLVGDLASQAGLVLRNVRLIEELRASRQRLVSAQDQERRRIERNIHDGAQQQLVALAVQLRLLGQTIDRDPAAAKRQAELLQTSANETLEDLRDLARGIYPPLLADRGLPEALEAQVRRSPVPVRLEAEGVDRLPADAEAAVYFCVLEALNNVAKYANADGADVRLARENGTLVFLVRDEGVGFEPEGARHGTGLQGMADRLEAIGGRLEVESRPGAGTTVIGRVPAS